ncbi:MAG: divalent-cation tolerance protein CutA [Ignavibacteriae bacterium]|nr:divalent-cation tolerance protein CutA [Ignavibacteriota bacterium]
MEKTNELRIVFVTTANFENARQISKILVTEKLAACCSIIQNVTSIFGWEGTIHERNEYMIMIKTTEKRLPELEERVKQMHSDDVPEIISLNIDKSSESFMQWIMQCIM